MDNAKKFFGEIIRTEEAKALFASFEKPENEEETLRLYIEVAAKFGIELSAEEITAYFAEKAPAEELDDDELTQLVGGGDHAECEDTFRNEENCWWNDGCDRIFNDYNNYICSSDYYYIRDGKTINRCSEAYFRI